MSSLRKRNDGRKTLLLNDLLMRFAFVGGTRVIGHAAARAIAMGHEVFLLHRGTHPSSLVDLPSALEHLGPMPNNFVRDTSRIRDRLGFREITTEGSRLADLIAWVRETRAS